MSQAPQVLWLAFIGIAVMLGVAVWIPRTTSRCKKAMLSPSCRLDATVAWSTPGDTYYGRVKRLDRPLKCVHMTHLLRCLKSELIWDCQ